LKRGNGAAALITRIRALRGYSRRITSAEEAQYGAKPSAAAKQCNKSDYYQLCFKASAACASTAAPSGASLLTVRGLLRASGNSSASDFAGAEAFAALMHAFACAGNFFFSA